MTKMLHYQTSSGATGACKIYTTEEECPSPNLKVQIDATTGYVKLSEEENNPDATPIRVHVNSSGKTLKVCKEAIPTGSVLVSNHMTFTVPSGITVLRINSPAKSESGGDDVGTFIGVTPNSNHILMWKVTYGENTDSYQVICYSHKNKQWSVNYDYGRDAKISWSPKINNHKVDITDY